MAASSNPPRPLLAVALAALASALAALTSLRAPVARAGDAPGKGAPGKPAAPAAAPKGPPAADVQKAIDAGAGWLRQQFAKGFEDTSRSDCVELVVLTLAHAGANQSDAVFAKGLALLEKTEPRFTYRTSLLAMALAEVNPRLYQRKIAHCAQWLVDTQLSGGEWGYPGTANGPGFTPRGTTVAPPPPAEGSKPGDRAPRPKVAIRRGESHTAEAGAAGKGDFSNTQLAILALRSCRD